MEGLSKRKRTHGHGQQCGDCCEEGDLRGPSGNENIYNKDSIKKRNNIFFFFFIFIY